jgi:hypothetical protein
MKNKFFSLFLAAAVCLGMMACDNSAYDANPDTNYSLVKNPLNANNGKAPMSARINNVAWEAMSAIAKDTMGMFMIQGVSMDMKAIGIMLIGYNGPGTYTFGMTNMGVYQDGSTVQNATSGQAVISSDQDGKSKGTFEFQAGSMSITDGKFDIARQ